MFISKIVFQLMKEQHVLEDQLSLMSFLFVGFWQIPLRFSFNLRINKIIVTLRYKPTTQRIIGLRFTYALSTYHVLRTTYHVSLAKQRDDAERRLSKFERCCCCCCRRRFDFVVLSYDERKCNNTFNCVPTTPHHITLPIDPDRPSSPSLTPPPLSLALCLFIILTRTKNNARPPALFLSLSPFYKFTFELACVRMIIIIMYSI